MVAARALSILSADDRATVARWLAEFGMEPTDLDACPPLRRLVEMLACVRIVRDLSPALSREKAWAEASAMLKLRDPLRTWHRWQKRAYQLEDARFCQDGLGEATDSGYPPTEL